MLIDEYDAPIRTANENGFLKEALGLFKPLYCGLSKSSPAKVCFTGILMVAANTMFSTLNNLMVCDINSSGDVSRKIFKYVWIHKRRSRRANIQVSC